MAVKLQLRRDTSANWASADPVLAEGEPGFDTTNRLWKTGDGTTGWSGLAYDGGAVDSVNGQTGVVELDPDDLDDAGTTNKFASSGQLDTVDYLTSVLDTTIMTMELATGIAGATVPATIKMIVAQKASATAKAVLPIMYTRLASAPSPAKAWHEQSADGAWWQIHAADEVNPCMFGANATAGTDQTTAVQAAIDYAVEFQSTFWLPDGDYDIPTAGLTITGQFASRPGPGELRRTTNVATVLLSASSVTAGVDVNGIRFRYTPGTSTVNGNHCAVRLDTCPNSFIRNCRCIGLFYVALEIRDCENGEVSHNFVSGADNRAIYVSADTTAAQNIKVMNNAIRGNSVTDYGINTNCFGTGQITDIQILHNEIETCVNQGIEIGDKIVAFMVSDNLVHGITSGPGILIQKANGFAPADSVVTANFVRSCQEGIYANDVFYVSITDNTALSCGTGIKLLDFRYGSVSGNNARACSGNGIDIDASTAANTTGNQFVNNYALQCAGTGIISTANVRNSSFIANRAMLNTTAQANVDNTAATHIIEHNAW